MIEHHHRVRVEMYGRRGRGLDDASILQRVIQSAPHPRSVVSRRVSGDSITHWPSGSVETAQDDEERQSPK